MESVYSIKPQDHLVGEVKPMPRFRFSKILKRKKSESLTSYAPKNYLRISEVVSGSVRFLEALLILRLVFLLGGANPSLFVTALYGITNPLVAPAQTLLPAQIIGSSLLDPATAILILLVPVIGKIMSISIDYYRITHKVVPVQN